jgi:S-adenosylmethionine synthetase
MGDIVRKIVVRPTFRPPIEEDEVEMCERKGIGHPDTITDGVCEAASRALSVAYLQTYGSILHHNLDKGLLVAGKSAPHFGGGEWIDPIKIFVCGRATNSDPQINIKRIVTDAARGYLERTIRRRLNRFEILTEISEGSADLKEVFRRSPTVPLSNDTSFGCGYAPYSRLERQVLTLSRLIESSGFRSFFPAAGDDYKIMGHRVNGKTFFTIALAFVDRYVEGVEHYFSVKRAIHDYFSDHLDAPATIRINTLDNPSAIDESGVYLTVSGLSAEMGDDGQVGRGNRVNGLITPGREMSLEAAAGKNPISHVGKIYNVLAHLMARAIHEKIDAVEEVSIKLLSAIGEPTDQPQVADVEIRARGCLTAEIKQKASVIADEWLESIDRVTDLILEEKATVY